MRIQPPTKCVPGVKRSEREAEHSSSFNTEVKNVYIFISIFAIWHQGTMPRHEVQIYPYLIHVLTYLLTYSRHGAGYSLKS